MNLWQTDRQTDRQVHDQRNGGYEPLTDRQTDRQYLGQTQGVDEVHGDVGLR